ncbi:hypothetical protein [Delftia tsuruhatensis]|jgi:hypothetical protein|uniref:Uncharacterized protein n=1 Tax=Delftia tsuruhatensis TaxID=180282 RepID=A0ABN4SDP6_9BURK|nr:hypothetical protein [Delftia tsuruhatensis]AOV01706.1 hypothetical protein BI380_10240 [Delftia tsuruhatensis]
MTRYQALRRMGFDPLASGFVAFLNFLFGAPRNEIRVMHTVIEFDAEEQRPGNTLIELLGKHLDTWPEGYGRVIQTKDGSFWASSGYDTGINLFQIAEIATDRETAVATKAKWLAQRAQAAKEQA